MNKLIIWKMNVEQKIWELAHDENGMGVVEIILITIVLISLVIIFKKQITGVVNDILSKMSGQANQV
ncbi:MAG: Flp1 family type IVb pilin [Clostridiales bacterium]|nr:Flp1 family type IVb pilin [Clostridiales bacterium]MDU1042058.1 Flp1 family type IVb pilin [Clostridiales bacterium]